MTDFNFQSSRILDDKLLICLIFGIEQDNLYDVHFINSNNNIYNCIQKYPKVNRQIPGIF